MPKLQLATAILLALGTEAVTSTQQRNPQPRAYLAWRAQIEDADTQIAGSTIYRARRQIVVSLSVFNESGSSATFDSTAFMNHVRTTIEHQTPLATSVRWFVPGARAGAPADTEMPRAVRQLAPGSGTRLRTVIESNDGLFRQGDYVIRIKLDQDDLSTVITAPGVAFRTHAEVALKLRIVEPQTPEQRAADYMREGRTALQSNQLQEAERLFRAALGVDGGNVSAFGELGGVYLRLGRYREAIDYLQRVPLGGPGFNVTGQSLAQAYVGIGDDARAVQVLTRVGMPNAMIATELERMKRAVATRR